MLRFILIVVIAVLSIYLVVKVLNRSEKCKREGFGQDPTSRTLAGGVAGPIMGPYGRSGDLWNC